ncbi:hypothetical protein [Fluviispira sanaruensis]|uniref:Uncharacterized protein n=1 Tax=Fluviispira sanaruensis TaxID=2493639 RepID=A0A4P2VQV6_FLUSA|nr:hypothetical protein [Fluviispira sanaruensis]BBH54614.1 hypothetical protein JCM31447_30880 [Fluviispira sanaruensis]
MSISILHQQKELLLKNIYSYPEADGLPDHFVENILKIGFESGKLADIKWLKKMLSNAKKSHQIALAAKIIKEEKKKEKLKNIEQDKSEKKQEFLYYISKLPRFNGYSETFPKVSKSASFFIVREYGSWTFQAMSSLKDTKRIYSFWAVQFAATLSKIGIKKIVEVINNGEDLYEYVIKSEFYNESLIDRNRYFFEKEENKKKKEKQELIETTL